MKPKRILFSNKFNYIRGGDYVVMNSTERALHKRGYETAEFAMEYEKNEPSSWSGYFAREVSFFNNKLCDRLDGAKRVLGLGDITQSFSKILDDFRPDVVHLHNIHSYLSPVIARLAHRRGCRVVWTLHDYKLLCPTYACLRDGQPCEKCYTCSKLPVIAHRCMKGSLAASVMAWLEAVRWDRKTLEKCVDAFVCPSEFMAAKMKQGGFSPQKLNVICNFVSPDIIGRITSQPSPARSDYFIYAGRISPEKGIRNLLEVASALPYRLIVAGDGPLREELQTKYKRCDNLTFTGHLPQSQLAKLVQEARFAVLPSQWYENNPLGVIEALCAGTPVVGSRMGGIPELIDENCGLIFSAFDSNDLTDKLNDAMQCHWDNELIAQKAQQRFSEETHIEKLLKIYFPEGAMQDDE